ncbi:formin-like protein 5 [Iris pallida]|uniref:Formin-like protein 5 n=1 Tax=Iris pallida TaxID=29817 RepID=A0AAX6GMD7_IRIPA|nr:formin-like protein 5 [Iris pallida]
MSRSGRGALGGGKSAMEVASADTAPHVSCFRTVRGVPVRAARGLCCAGACRARRAARRGSGGAGVGSAASGQGHSPGAPRLKAPSWAPPADGAAAAPPGARAPAVETECRAWDASKLGRRSKWPSAHERGGTWRRGCGKRPRGCGHDDGRHNSRTVRHRVLDNGGHWSGGAQSSGRPGRSFAGASTASSLESSAGGSVSATGDETFARSATGRSGRTRTAPTKGDQSDEATDR